jgi:hypothetical protein
LNRQALLDYEKDPQGTLGYLKGQLGLAFDHFRKPANGSVPHRPFWTTPA